MKKLPMNEVEQVRRLMSVMGRAITPEFSQKAWERSMHQCGDFSDARIIHKALRLGPLDDRAHYMKEEQ